MLRKDLPELPSEKRKRYRETFGVKDEDIEMYVADRELDAFFMAAMKLLGDDLPAIQRASNYITSDIAGLRQTVGDAVFARLRPAQFVTLMRLLEENKLSSRGAKDVLKIMVQEGGEPEAIAKREGLLQENDEATLRNIVEVIIQANQNIVEEYISGKENALQFLVGQGMKATKGAANPTLLAALFKEIISTR